MTTREYLELATHRLVSREASVEDVEHLARRARAGDAVLEALLGAARDDAELRAQLAAALPDLEAVGAPRLPQVRAGRFRWTGAPGWLAAAMIAITWGAFSVRTGPGPVVRPVALLPTADEALDRYITAGVLEGRVIAELPTLMVESRPLAGGAEVVYIRRLLERAVVDEIVEQAVDDAGRIVQRQVSPSAYERPESL